MNQKETEVVNPANSSFFNRLAYAIMLTVGLFFFMFKDYSQATIFIGLALIFDPFDQTVSFKNRPFWQKTWLIVQCVCSFIIFGLLISGK